ncbi:hypothetical protein HF521_009198 [Silurus meridionalis]|uniref:Immunoglobulin domain-containing protein n=1 Tax=Silurus meridionalis TaxID=175797 RepID=A0A8T0BXQ7_SILME|nr:hypothetical protein HF521_009198 [Silurus meridionalis]
MRLSWVLAITVALALPFKAMGAIERQEVQLGKPVILKCNISLHHEIFWLKVNNEEKPRIVLVARLKNNGGLTEVMNYNTTHYEGCMIDRFFGLKISSVLNSDLGSYYCGIVEGKRMEFEDGVHIYEDKDECVSSNKKASTIHPTAETRSNSYRVFAAVLGVGLLVMVLVFFIVHMITCRK